MSLVRGLSLSLSSLKWVLFKWSAQKHPRNEKPQHWPQDFSADSLPFFNAICDQSDWPKWPLTSDSNRSCGRWTIQKKQTKRITWFSQRIFPLILPVTIGPARKLAWHSWLCLFGQGNGLVMFRDLIHILWISTRYFQEKTPHANDLAPKPQWDWDSTCGILHILPSLTLIHLRLVSRYFQHHMNLNHPLWISTIRGSGFPLPGDISRIPYMFDGSPSFMVFWSGSKEDLQEPAKKWWGTPWFPIDFPWISRH